MFTPRSLTWHGHEVFGKMWRGHGHGHAQSEKRGVDLDIDMKGKV